MNSNSTTVSHNLFDWGLPPAVAVAYRQNGISEMFTWQTECLTTDGVLSGKNLVYSAPTSAGKTLVSEVLMLKRVIETKRKALFVLPFVSVAREKMYSLQRTFQEAGIKVGGAMGSHHPPGGLRALDVCVCTIEKANGFINRLIEDDCLDQLCCLVIDELHMLGDSSRGYLLELLLTKVLYLQRRKEDIGIQIVGMSAVLPNLDKLAEWLNAALYRTDFRPVPLNEFVKMGRQLNNVPSLTLARKLNVNPPLPVEDPDFLLYLTVETVSNAQGVVIFCPSKKGCEATSSAIARCIYNIGKDMSPENELGSTLRKVLCGEHLQDVLEQLKQTSAGLDSVLERTIPYGVAFHHAGLTFDERDIIEAGFRKGHLRVIVATSTLSSGVNLPARRVIIRTPLFNGRPLDFMTYKQMVGRAGRKGIDSEGEAILLCRENEIASGIQLVKGSAKAIESCLSSSNQSLTQGLKRAILEIIAAGVATEFEHIQMYAASTLCFVLSGATQQIESCITFLLDNQFIASQTDDSGKILGYFPTPLGKAVLSSSLSPDDALFVLSELKSARQSFVLENDLHITYQVTPFYLSAQVGHVDWMHFWGLWEHLSEDEKRVGNLVGIEEKFITMCLRGCVNFRTPQNARLLSIHQRFYVALALCDLIKEMPLGEVSQKYFLEKGLLQSLQQSAAVFAGMVGIFCKRLGWHNLELLITHFHRRLHFGVQLELCGLLRVIELTSTLARALYDAGFSDVPDLAAAEVSNIELALSKVRPFDKRSDESPGRWVLLNGFDTMTEKEAALLISRAARKFVESEFGVKVSWSQKVEPISSSQLTPKRNSNSFVTAPSRLVDKSISLDSPQYLLNPAATDSTKLSLSSHSRQSIDQSPVSSRSFLLKRHFKEDFYEIQTQRVNKRVSLEPYQSQLDQESTSDDDNNNEIICGQLNNVVSAKNDHSLANNRLEYSVENSSLNDTTHSCDKRSETSKLSSGDELFAVCDIPTLERTRISLSCGSNDLFVEPRPPEKSYHSPRAPQAFEDSLQINSQLAALIDGSLVGSPARSKRSLSKEASRSSSGPTANVSDDLFEIPTSPIVIGQPLRQTSTPRSECIGDSVDCGTLQRLLCSQLENEDEFDADIASIVDVCADVTVFNNFRTELRNQTLISISIAAKSLADDKKTLIGPPTSLENKLCPHSNEISDTLRLNSKTSIVGIAFSWDGNDAYYLSLQDSVEDSSDHAVSLETRLEVIVEFITDSPKTIVAFDILEHWKALHKIVKLWPNSCVEVEDPKIGFWLCDPSVGEPTAQGLVGRYIPGMISLVNEVCGGNTSCCPLGFLGLFDKHNSSAPPRILSSLEAVLMYRSRRIISHELDGMGLLSIYRDYEMRIMPLVARMDATGIGVDRGRLRSLVGQLRSIMATLETRAHQIAQQNFTISSHKQLSAVVKRVMHDALKATGFVLEKRTVKVAYASKAVLQRLAFHHPLAQLILDWRKVNAILIKNINPLLKHESLDAIDGLCRIQQSTSFYTVTGRIVLHEPNLQGMARNFKVVVDGATHDIFVRKIFVPTEDNRVFLSADYSQLEMRLLAHLSQDSTLVNIFLRGGDIFKEIAAKISGVSVEEVDSESRCRAKQICYGIVYGKGIRTLAEDLNVGEEDAQKFLEMFRSTFPGIPAYIERVIEGCKRRGFVRTLFGRRRYLPHVANDSQSQRQAVNTSIQGSAADLLKAAIVSFDKSLREYGLEHSAMLVLQLHDELLIEVTKESVTRVGCLVKQAMRNASPVPLSVPLEVNLKVGEDWSAITDLEL